MKKKKLWSAMITYCLNGHDTYREGVGGKEEYKIMN